MRFVIVNTDYPAFLVDHYAANEGLERARYGAQLQARNATLFGTADFYTHALRQDGYKAFDIHLNNWPLQAAWAEENGWRDLAAQLRTIPFGGVPTRGLLRRAYDRLGRSKGLGRLSSRLLSAARGKIGADPSLLVIDQQIAAHAPDVVLVLDMTAVPRGAVEKWRGQGLIVVGQHAATALPPAVDACAYDLVVSSWPPTLHHWGRQGARTARVDLGFEPRVLSRIGHREKEFDVTFVGSLSGVHTSRIRFLEAVATALPTFKHWGPGVSHLPLSSPLRACYQGTAWGHQMYDVLSRSRVTLNHHGDVEHHANNMRLFEATGVGTCLVTDDQPDLERFFAHGLEVEPYQGVSDAIERIEGLLRDATRRNGIAKVGQARTLADHTYLHRMRDLAAAIRTCAAG